MIGRIGYYFDLNIGGQISLQLGKSLFHRFGNGHRICPCLFLHNKGCTTSTIRIIFENTTFYRITYGCHIAKINRLSLTIAYDKRVKIATFGHFPLQTQHIRLRSDIEITGRYVHVFCSNYLSNLFKRETISLQFLRSNIYLYFTLRCPRYGNRTHTRYTVQGIGYLVIQYFIHGIRTYVGGSRKGHHRHHICTEFQEHGIGNPLRKKLRCQLQFIPHIIHCIVGIGSVFELEQYQGYSVFRTRNDMF
jgi:hypothetical protein